MLIPPCAGAPGLCRQQCAGTPRPCTVAQRSGARARYLISTLAPASSNFFLMASASSFDTPSLIVFGALSTRSFASFRPRLVTSRTALMTLILFGPTSLRTTVNSVFSSAGAAGPAAAGAPATTTGAAAAAETPNVSSIFLTSSAASSSVRLFSSSRIASTLLAIARFSFSLRLCELLGLDGLVHRHGQSPRDAGQRLRQPRRRTAHQECNASQQLLARGQLGQRSNFFDRNDASFDDSGPELQGGNFTGEPGQRAGQRHRIGRSVGNGIGSGEPLQDGLGRGAGGGALSHRILDYPVAPAGAFDRPPQLGLLLDFDPLEGRQNDRGNVGQLLTEALGFLLFLPARLHRCPLTPRRLAPARPRTDQSRSRDPWSSSG